jgi:hypothetical protein
MFWFFRTCLVQSTSEAKVIGGATSNNRVYALFYGYGIYLPPRRTTKKTKEDLRKEGKDKQGCRQREDSSGQKKAG